MAKRADIAVSGLPHRARVQGPRVIYKLEHEDGSPADPPTMRSAAGVARQTGDAILGPGAPPIDETKARSAFVCGGFRRLHRTGLIACHYRAAEWRHKEVELTAHDLLRLLDISSS